MSADRFRDVLAALLDELLPRRRFYAPIRYRVDKCEAGKFSATPEDKSAGFPPIVDAPVRGIAGGNAASKLKSGTSVLVSFVEGDPGDPFLAWIDEAVAPDELAHEAATKAKTTAPTIEHAASTKHKVTAGAIEYTASGQAKIDGATVVINGGAMGAARQGDAVIAGPFPGTITGPCSLTVKIG